MSTVGVEAIKREPYSIAGGNPLMRNGRGFGIIFSSRKVVEATEAGL